VSNKRLLNDAEYLRYLTEGYLTVTPDSLTDADHDHFYEQANGLHEAARLTSSPVSHLDTLGDNLRARIPRLDALLGDPAVRAALLSILGEDYLLHPHHFVHRALPSDQPFHQDGNLPWNERGHYRPHRPDWALMFYYPQAVTLENGPTEVVPGSQYWTTDFEKEDGTWYAGDGLDKALDRQQLAVDDLAHRDRVIAAGLDKLQIPDLRRTYLTVPRGSVVVCSYDLIHRGSRAAPGQASRYMYKFYFARTRDPVAPSWRNRRKTPDLEGVSEALAPVVSYAWYWSRGALCPAPQRTDLVALANQLEDGREDQQVAAAYRLGAAARHDAGALELLVAGLDGDRESTRRAAGYGLRAAADAALGPLTRMIGATRPGTRRLAVFALGNAENAASTRIVNALIRALESDPDDLVRSNAAYALGQLLRRNSRSKNRIVTALLGRLAPAVEPDNTSIALLSRSTVRQSVAYALLQAAANGLLNRAQLQALVEVSIEDPDRYVQGFAIESLRRAADLNAGTLARALDVLARSRYSPPPLLRDGAAGR
jgi:HEAT repeat protein/ectoine hydroxylase-related dioxygenase (phytanoyl-CoA dioxygenase family)